MQLIWGFGKPYSKLFKKNHIYHFVGAGENIQLTGTIYGREIVRSSLAQRLIVFEMS